MKIHFSGFRPTAPVGHELDFAAIGRAALGRSRLRHEADVFRAACPHSRLLVRYMRGKLLAYLAAQLLWCGVMLAQTDTHIATYCDGEDVGELHSVNVLYS